MSGLKAYIEQLEIPHSKGKIKKIPLSVRLKVDPSFKLDRLAKKYGKSKGELAEEILSLALDEVWESANMPSTGELQEEKEAFVAEQSKKKRRPRKAKE